MGNVWTHRKIPFIMELGKDSIWVNRAELFIQSMKVRSTMKNEYNKKKRITIIALSALAVCLAAGLFWYMGTLGNTQPPAAQTESQPEPEPSVTVPEIKPESTKQPTVAEQGTTKPDTSEPETTSAPKTGNSQTGTVTGDVQAKPSEGKPKSPAEATPPAEPPKESAESSAPVENPDASGQCQPEHTSQPEPEQPQGGETRSDGAVYVPGFGWVPYEGENSTETAPNAGTGKPVGEM